MKAERDLVFDAVRQTETTRAKSWLQKLFAVYFDAFVYNQIWEDPRVDAEALEIDAGSRIVTISSGGCNALNYLVHNPESVTAVDLNRHHIYLLNLKIAALRSLSEHQEFFELFGNGRSARAAELWSGKLAPSVDDATREFWNSKTLSGRRRISFFEHAGLYEHSRNGWFLRFFHRFAKLVGAAPEEILTAKTTDQQAEIYEQKIAPFFDSLVIRVIGRLPVTLFGLGIPPQQYDELLKEVGDGKSIIDVYRERTRRLAVDFPIQDNYFAWQAFARKYDTENCLAIPDYLRAEHFTDLKARAGKLETVIGSITDVIRERPRGTFNRFVFLDAQDWMDAATMTELWSLIADRAAPGARIIFRTAGASSPIETALPPELRRRFVYHEELSRDWFRRDRASIYGGFHLYELTSDQAD